VITNILIYNSFSIFASALYYMKETIDIDAS